MIAGNANASHSRVSAARAADLLDASDRRRDVLAGMAYVLGKVHIEKVEIAKLGAVDEGGPPGRGAAPASDDRRATVSCGNRRHDVVRKSCRLAVDCPKGATQCVED